MKKYYVLALIFAGSLKAEGPSLRDSNVAKLVGSLLVGGLVKTAGDAASGNNTIKKLGEAFGLNPRDVSKTCAVVSTFGTYALFESDKKNKETYKYVATRMPLIVLGMGIAYSQKFQRVLKNTPLVGDFIGCDNQDCTGVCSECILTKGAVGYGVSKSLCVALDYCIAHLKEE